ncbi:MAG: lipid II flippase MurJ [Candidatus Edwardsbacteria bacterium]
MKILTWVNVFRDKLKAKSIVRDTLTTTILLLMAKAVGLLVPFFVAAWFGVSSQTDAFFFSYGLVLFISGILAQVVESIIVPYVVEAKAKEENIGSFVGKIVAVSGGGFVVVTGMFLLMINPILSTISHFDSSSLNLVRFLLIEISPLGLLLIWTSILSGTFNAYKKFAISLLSSFFRAPLNLVIIFLLKDKIGIHAIAAGYLTGEVARLFFLWIKLNKLEDISLCLSFILDSKTKEFFLTAFYQTLGMVAVGLNPIIDKTMASWLGEGNISILEYADRLYMIPVTFMSAGLFITLLSYWSEEYYQVGLESLKRNVKRAVKMLIPTTLAIAGGFILIHRPLVHLILGWGSLNGETLNKVGGVLICNLLGFTPYLIGLVYVKAHVVLKNTKTILYLAILNCICNVLLNYFLMQIFGVRGIALSTSITYSIVMIGFLLTFLNKSRMKRNGDIK